MTKANKLVSELREWVRENEGSAALGIVTNGEDLSVVTEGNFGVLVSAICTAASQASELKDLILSCLLCLAEAEAFEKDESASEKSDEESDEVAKASEQAEEN